MKESKAERRWKDDAKFVNVSEPYEVEYAKLHGEVTVDKDGTVHPVKGKTKKLRGRIVRLKHPY